MSEMSTSETSLATPCSKSDETGHFTPLRLFDISIGLIARNINLVDSLVDFPEVVGHQLFQHVIKAGIFENPYCLQILQLFHEAYSDLVLSGLNLNGCHLLLSQRQNELMEFSMLQSLDLSHCKLGNDQETFNWISNLKNVQHLNLTDNCLADNLIRKLTLPCRMSGAGLTKLKHLDLSKNKCITDDAVKFLTKLTSLKSLNLSGTSVTYHVGCRKLIGCLSLHLTNQIPLSVPAITNTGWAEPLITQWIQLAIKQKDLALKQLYPLKSNRIKEFYDSSAKRLPQLFPLGMKTNNKKESNGESKQLMVLCAKELLRCEIILDVEQLIKKEISLKKSLQGVKNTAKITTHSAMTSSLVHNKDSARGKTLNKNSSAARKRKYLDEDESDFMCEYFSQPKRQPSTEKKPQTLWSAMKDF